MTICLDRVINSMKAAAKVLSSFPNLGVAINNVRIVNPNLLIEWTLEKEFYYVVLKSRFCGGLNGEISAIMDMASCDELINNVTGKHINVLSDYEKSILQEFLNVFVGNFLANYTEEHVNYEVPRVCIYTMYDVLKEVSDDCQIFKISCDKPIMRIFLLLKIEDGDGRDELR